MKYFPLFELSDEIQALVVERVARNSFQDLYGLKALSKSMKALAERHRVYHFYDFFFSFSLKEEGLSLMKRAADAGYECVRNYSSNLLVCWAVFCWYSKRIS
ncbi:unnamed protein product [Brassica rapa]|uniref:F-box domain-containing protein n=1 Tax=Brassica campestris TaxID=3711 RepID=A0A3P5Z5R9_BRACM|nr:unnamed protein product [Brassica rapa]VDC71105.1 unnamed protein product [Brassica rapa]